MDPGKRLEQVQARAAMINISIAELCGFAGQKPGTVYGWLRADRDPQMGNFGRTVGALEAELDRREQIIFLSLAPKFLPADILATLNLATADEGEGAARQEAAE